MSNEVTMQWDVKIPLRDGVQLSAIVYLPQPQTAPSPAILLLTPYIAQTYHDRGTYYASRGFPFIAVDVRGRGNSEGEFKCYGTEAQDGHDIVEWIARQPFCNGKVTMSGGSYSGYAQWMVMTQRSPHLATIVPVASPHRGLDSPMRNNFLFAHRTQWLTLLSGRTSQEKIFGDQAFWHGNYRRWFESGQPFKSLDGSVGNPHPTFQEWVEHPHLDDYWDKQNPTAEDYAKLDMPVLTITGTYDGNQIGALHHYREHFKHNPRANHYIIIGPWDHAGTRTPKLEFAGVKCAPASQVDLQNLHCEWYNWTMSSGPKPEFLKTKAVYYVMGAERWRYADSLDGITARTEALYLHSTGQANDVFASGLLTPKAQTSGPDQYVYDPRDISLAKLDSTVDPENRADHRMIYAAAGKHLVYHSEPFEQDTELSGFFRLRAWLSIDQPDTDFSVSVYDIAPDGSAILMTNDMLRARHRESLHESKPIDTTDALPYDFNRFMFTSRSIRKGHRLRLVIGPINSIHMQKNYNTGGTISEESMKDARTVTVKLFHDAERPSALYIPHAHPVKASP